MKLRIVVDPDLCIGAASCVTIAPDTFVMNTENKAEVLDHGVAEGAPAYERITEATEDEMQNIILGAQSCPTLAITVFNVDTGEQLYPTL